MSEPTQPENNKSEPKLGFSISKNSLLLGFFAVITTAIIAGTHSLTKDKITYQQQQARLKALYQIVPKATHDNDMLQDNFLIQEKLLGHRDEQTVYVAKNGQQVSSLIYPITARDGYSGDINLIVGVNLNGTVAGVRTISHKETPGLGDKIELRKDDWILDFAGKSLRAPTPNGWTVKKDGGEFDSFTGATITPRAVTQAVAKVLTYHEQNAKQLIKQFEKNGNNP